MQTWKEVRFVTTNFYNLQGLRFVPLGLALIMVALWANGMHAPARSAAFLVPLFELVIAAVIFWGIDRYYQRSLGQVKRTPESLRLEWLEMAIFGLFALGAFWLDASNRYKVSYLGLVFALGLVTDYIRMTWLVKGHFLLYYPIGAFLIGFISLLPLFPGSNWWQVFGMKSQLLGIAILIGTYVVIAGLWGHVFLLKALSMKGEEK